MKVCVHVFVFVLRGINGSAVSLFNHHILSLTPHPHPTPAPSSSSFSRSSLFLDLEDEQAQVDVFGSQQFVALHRVGDGQRDVVGLVGVVAEGVVVDNRLDPHIVVGALQ